MKFGNAGQVAIPTIEELLIINLTKFGNPAEISSFEKRNYECVQSRNRNLANGTMIRQPLKHAFKV